MKIRGFLKNNYNNNSNNNWKKGRKMGAAGSKLEKALGDQFPEGERYFGLEHLGNTCYCNSVLQV